MQFLKKCTINYLHVEMVGLLQVLRGSPSHPVTVGTTLAHDDKSLRTPRGWRERSSATVQHFITLLHVLSIDS